MLPGRFGNGGGRFNLVLERSIVLLALSLALCFLISVLGGIISALIAAPGAGDPALMPGGGSWAAQAGPGPRRTAPCADGGAGPGAGECGLPAYIGLPQLRRGAGPPGASPKLTGIPGVFAAQRNLPAGLDAVARDPGCPAGKPAVLRTFRRRR